MTSAASRIKARVTIDDAGCWLWRGHIDRYGYGKAHVDGSQMGAHVASYRAFVGAVPEGLELDHLCRVRRCVRPDHLEPVTHRQNVLRGAGFAAVNAAKTHCSRGHEFTEANTYNRPDAPTTRNCKTCLRASWRRYRDRRDQKRRANPLTSVSDLPRGAGRPRTTTSPTTRPAGSVRTPGRDRAASSASTSPTT